jgi:hypothetical protein
MKISIYTKDSATYITGREYDFKVAGSYQGKFKVVKVSGETVTMELDEIASAAYTRFIDNNNLKYFSMGSDITVF